MKRSITILIAIIGILMLCSCDTPNDKAVPVDASKDYTVSVEQSGELTLCQVTFKQIPRESSVAAQIVRSAIESLVRENRDREILATAFNEAGDALPETQYGGALAYNPSDGKILTMEQRRGNKTTEVDEGSYFVKLEELRTAKGITPIRRWLDISVVFPNKPTNDVVKSAVENELGKLKVRGLDINAYVFVGDKSNPGSWKQVKASNGKYMAIDYRANTGKTVPNWNWN